MSSLLSNLTKMSFNPRTRTGCDDYDYKNQY